MVELLKQAQISHSSHPRYIPRAKRFFTQGTNENYKTKFKLDDDPNYWNSAYAITGV